MKIKSHRTFWLMSPPVKLRGVSRIFLFRGLGREEWPCHQGASPPPHGPLPRGRTPGRSQHHFLEGDTGSGSEVLEFTTGSGPLNNGKRFLTEEPRASGSDAHSSNYRHRIQERIAPGSIPALLL
ncbi:unnamed protein product, partial [Gulo gulo]